MRVLLLSTYDLGHQPFGLASPAAWLRARGHEVVCADLSLDQLSAEAVSNAELVAIHLPMHTATRLAAPVIRRVRNENAMARICCYGLYAPLNSEYLRALGADHILGGEFEEALAALADARSPGSADLIVLDRLTFQVPDRTALPALSRYAALVVNGERKQVGYTEASRGCKHLCRHCPVVNVYGGKFRVIPPANVISDISNLVRSGAQHITFGDPDFFNGPRHAIAVLNEFAREFPDTTYDVTIKVEHLLQRQDLLPMLRHTGCLFVTSAVESLDDEVLRQLEKGHTRQDFLHVLELFRKEGLTISPTFIPFTPWTTLESYTGLLATIAAEDLIENVNPVQLALRLLIPDRSRLLDLPSIQAAITGFDQAALLHKWKHPDPQLDSLAGSLLRLVAAGQKRGNSRSEIFMDICAAVNLTIPPPRASRATIPFLEEPWYC